MAQEYDAKWNIEQQANNITQLQQRIIKLENAFDALFEAVTVMANRSNLLLDPQIKEKLERAMAYRQ